MRPNILLITIDCWRFDRLDDRVRNLQTLANEGVSFQRAYSDGGWTQAAFPALLTSTYASMYDGCLGPLSDERPYLPEWLQKRGYNTLAVQTSPLLDRTFGYGRGMDKLASLQPPWQAPSWYRKRGIQRLLRRGGIHRVAQLAKFKSRPAPAYANAQSATEEAVAMLATAQEPFFLWVHYMDAHWPYFDQEGYESPAELALSWQDRQEGFLATRKKNRQHPSTETMARWVRMYDQALQAIDRQIGRLLYAVEEQVGADTLVIATGDHGEEFFEHGHFGHSRGSLYEEILHVPLIMAHPKFSTPSTIQTPVAQVDIAPTITDLLESHVPESMLGESLLPLITERGTAKTEARPIISECHWGDEVHMVAIRAGEFKFIVDLRERDNWQLYNLCSDPEEKVNLRTQPPGNVPDFASMLDQHLAAVKASNIVAAESPEADEELLYRLRDLGYVD